MKRNHDLRVLLRPYAEGDNIYLLDTASVKGISRKLSASWKGPALIVKKLSAYLYRVKLRNAVSLYLACNDKNAFFTSEQPKRYKLWSCQKMCDALHYLLDNIFIRFGSKLYRQIVGIPMGTNCAPLVADLFLFCDERDFMLSLSDNNQTDIIEAFNSTSRYLDDLLNIDNPYFEQMVGQIYSTELQLNKANSSDTEAPFFE